MKILLKNINNTKKNKFIFSLKNKKFFASFSLYLALFIFLILMLYFLFNKKKTVIETIDIDRMKNHLEKIAALPSGDLGDKVLSHCGDQDS